jgi:type IV fimbrial biogenesis protein FimT
MVMLKQQRGFTFLELMITLTVAAILSTLAFPSFVTMTKNNRLTTQANDFILALNLTRSEAVKRGTSTTITATSGGGNWSNGWTVAHATAGTLRIGDALQDSMVLTNDEGNSTITYSSSGTAAGTPTAAPGIFELCDDRTGEIGRQISISTTGRVEVADFTCS